jgi:regulatory protein
MAQRWRARPDGQKSVAKPLDGDSLEALALTYAGRYATSRAKLAAYLRRKLRERGWDGVGPPPVEAIVETMAALRYVDDEAYAAMQSGAMQRRGLGARRIAQKLAVDGIAEPERHAAAPDKAERWAAAERLARRKRIGPFADGPADRPTREKHIATFLRAGHDMATARIWVDAAPGEMPVGPDVA